MLESGSLFTRVSLRAPIKAPSLPDSPTALPPALPLGAAVGRLRAPILGPSVGVAGRSGVGATGATSAPIVSEGCGRRRAKSAKEELQA